MTDDLPMPVRGILCPTCNESLDVVDASVRVASGHDASNGRRGVQFRCQQHGGWYWFEGETYLTGDDGKHAPIRTRASMPHKATVYHYMVGDITTGENVRRGPATLEAIWKAHVKPIWESSQELDLSELDGDGFSGRMGK